MFYLEAANEPSHYTQTFRSLARLTLGSSPRLPTLGGSLAISFGGMLKETKGQRLVRMMLEDERYVQPSLYNEFYSAAERRDLHKALNKTLWEEIVMMRTALKRFFGLLQKEEDAERLKSLTDSIQALGLACTRLARLMQINQLLQASQPGLDPGTLNKALEYLMGQWEEFKEDQWLQSQL